MVLDIVFANRASSSRAYRNLFDSSKFKPTSHNRYFVMLAEGLASYKDVNVSMVGAIAVNRKISNRLFFHGEDLIEKGVSYKTISIFNIPIMWHFITLIGCVCRIVRMNRSSENLVIICSVSDITLSIAALLSSMIAKVKTIAVVLDIPGDLPVKSHWIFDKLRHFFAEKHSAYVFLTRQMNEVMNIDNRSYVVIEGMVDVDVATEENMIDDKYDELVCLYTGSIQRLYGVDLLVNAFISAAIPNAVLHLYGTGDYEEELIKITQNHSNIRYGKVLPNEQILREQIKATLLVNPRPTAFDYTKYSFPSKNMEYIGSGTPLVTTRLPGMPDEYIPYVYLFEEETEKGFSETLQILLTTPREVLHAKGMRAKEFAIKKKNNILQADKLLEMIRK